MPVAWDMRALENEAPKGEVPVARLERKGLGLVRRASPMSTILVAKGSTWGARLARWPAGAERTAALRAKMPEKVSAVV